MYRATVTFSGLISMTAGEVRDITEPLIVSDLLKAGYIERVEEDKPEKQEKRVTRRKR